MQCKPRLSISYLRQKNQRHFLPQSEEKTGFLAAERNFGRLKTSEREGPGFIDKPQADGYNKPVEKPAIFRNL